MGRGVPLERRIGYGSRVSERAGVDSGPKDALVDAAERLFAEHGLDGVSMRDIAKAAGQRNNSAVAYHFGGRDGLVREVFRRRMLVINQRRREMVDALDGAADRDPLRALLEAMILPLAEHLRAAGPGSTYLQFLARVSPTVDFRDPTLASVRALHTELATRMQRELTHLSPATALARITLVLTMSASALAAFEQQWALGLVDGERELDAVVAHVVDLAVGGLRAGANAG
ncbi:helix-turn-helix domain-containing protein [Nocardioides dubius]|uniref:HTH tetR-type domain-containing protein n=1 Tax=Nocardioides dubius TaxID=317019 RepID=A0ABN1TVU3_9ACTN